MSKKSKNKDKRIKDEQNSKQAQPEHMTQEHFEKGCVFHADGTISTGPNYDFCKH